MPNATTKARHPGGRPPKFQEPSGPVTVTLPNRTLEQLRRIDEDRARAIVKAVDAVLARDTEPSSEAEIIEMAPGTGLVVVPWTESLCGLRWLKMIEVAPARYLLAIVPGTTVETIEVSLMDLLESAQETAPQDLPVLRTLAERIRSLRRGKKLSIAQILFVAV